MAARFWVGGTGNWSDTTHWSTTTGGAGGAAVPTSADDVTVDSNSGTGTYTITGDVAINVNNLTFNPSSSTRTLSLNAGLTCASTFSFLSGAWITNGQSAALGTFSATGSNIRTLTLGASLITISGLSNTAWNTTGGNITINPGTSTITFTGSQTGLANAGGANYTLNSVVFQSSQIWLQLSSSTTFNGNFTITGGASKTAFCHTTSSFIVSGVFTVTGNSATNRVLIDSYNGALTTTPGVTKTITVNGSHGAHANVDFMDITITGTAGVLTGTSIGDCQGNSGITFDASVTCTGPSVAGFTWSTAAWSSSGAARTAPLPQDDVIVDSRTTGTVTADMPRWGRTVNFTGFAGTLTPSVSLLIFGSLTLVPAMTLTVTGNDWSFADRRGSSTLTSAGKTLATSRTITFQGDGGGYTLQDDLTATNAGGVLQLIAGGLTAGAACANVKAGAFTFSSTSRTRSLNMGSATWTLLGLTATFGNGNATGMTFNAGASTITWSDTGAGTKLFSGGGFTYYALVHNAAGAGGLTISAASNTFTNLDLECTTAKTITLPAGTTQTITGTLTLKGAAGQNLSLVSSIPGTSTTLNDSAGGFSIGFTTMTRSADVIFQLGQTISATQGQSATTVRAASKTVTATQTQTASIVRAPSKTVLASASPVASVTRSALKVVLGTVIAKASIGFDSVFRLIGKIISGWTAEGPIT